MRTKDERVGEGVARHEVLRRRARRAGQHLALAHRVLARGQLDQLVLCVHAQPLGSKCNPIKAALWLEACQYAEKSVSTAPEFKCNPIKAALWLEACQCAEKSVSTAPEVKCNPVKATLWLEACMCAENSVRCCT